MQVIISTDRMVIRTLKNYISPMIGCHGRMGCGYNCVAIS